jgi:DNA-binding YbaB/EbfC family protein
MGLNMQKLMQLQAQMTKAQEKAAQELANMTVEGTAGGGAVVITVTCDNLPKSVKIDPAALDPEDVGALEDMILVALTSALEKAQQAQQDSQQRILTQMTGGMKLPPGFGF